MILDDGELVRVDRTVHGLATVGDRREVVTCLLRDVVAHSHHEIDALEAPDHLPARALWEQLCAEDQDDLRTRAARLDHGCVLRAGLDDDDVRTVSGEGLGDLTTVLRSLP